MSDMWSVAITQDDWEWLKNSMNTHLSNALGAVHGPDTDAGMAALPLYTDELYWLSKRLTREGSERSGLAFALYSAVSASHSVRMAREWSDRNEKSSKESLQDLERQLRPPSLQDLARQLCPPPLPSDDRDGYQELDYPDHWPFEG
mgnify:FL=1